MQLRNSASSALVSKGNQLRSAARGRHVVGGGRRGLICLAKLRLKPTGNGDSSHLPEKASLPKPYVLPSEGTALIGRSNADLTLPFGTVSKQHAMLEVTKSGEIFVTDLGSTNGTSLGGRPLKPKVRTRLNVGDEIQFGDPYLSKFVVEDTSAASKSGGGASSPFDFLQRLTPPQAAAAPAAPVATKPKAPPPPAPPQPPPPPPPQKPAPPPKPAAAPAPAAPAKPAEPPAPPKVSVKKTKKGTVIIARKKKPSVGFSLPFFGGGDQAKEKQPQPSVKPSASASLAKSSAAAPSSSASPPPASAATAAAPEAPQPSSASGPAERVTPELSFDDERMAAEAAVRAVEESLGMSVGEWREKLDEIARLAAKSGPSFQSQEASVVATQGKGAAGAAPSGTGRGGAGSEGGPGAPAPAAAASEGKKGAERAQQQQRAASPSSGEESEDEEERAAGSSRKLSKSGDAGRNPEIVPAGAAGIRKADESSPAAAPGGGFGGALGGMLSGLGNLITSSNVQINNQVTNIYNVSLGAGKGAEIAEAKAVLLRALLGTDRGAAVSAAARGKIEAATRALEALNPTPKPLRSPFLNGRWEMQYSTSPTGLGAGSGIPGLRPTGAPYQTIDMFGLLLLNEETYQPLPFIRWTNASAADLVPRTDSRMAVNVKGFKVAGIDVKAPPERTAAKWEQAVVSGGAAEPFIEVTYLDYDMRITRNHAGNLFVFTRPPIET